MNVQACSEHSREAHTKHVFVEILTSLVKPSTQEEPTKIWTDEYESHHVVEHCREEHITTHRHCHRWTLRHRQWHRHAHAHIQTGGFGVSLCGALAKAVRHKGLCVVERC